MSFCGGEGTQYVDWKCPHPQWTPAPTNRKPSLRRTCFLFGVSKHNKYRWEKICRRTRHRGFPAINVTPALESVVEITLSWSNCCYRSLALARLALSSVNILFQLLPFQIFDMIVVSKWGDVIFLLKNMRFSWMTTPTASTCVPSVAQT